MVTRLTIIRVLYGFTEFYYNMSNTVSDESDPSAVLEGGTNFRMGGGIFSAAPPILQTRRFLANFIEIR
jgi:hypothetical protein